MEIERERTRGEVEGKGEKGKEWGKHPEINFRWRYGALRIALCLSERTKPHTPFTGVLKSKMQSLRPQSCSIKCIVTYERTFWSWVGRVLRDLVKIAQPCIVRFFSISVW